MSTCKECIHFEVCDRFTAPNETYPEVGGCKVFKPQADYVEVVRCKDCECFNKGVCTEHSDGWGDHLVNVGEDDFCSFGYRKGGAE